jgi:hypothetical protein
MSAMNDVINQADMPPTSPAIEQNVKALCSELESKFPKAPIKIEHFIHEGMYVRTCWQPAGTVIVGALIKVPTVLVVDGNVRVNCGGKWINVEGHAVLKGSPGRRCIVVTYEDTYATLMFPTKAKTVEEAEMEMTDEYQMLSTRKS